jgi:succinate dehydrogenase / fumarate reductase iron-sulfur subunit
MPQQQETIELRIKRQDNPKSKPYWEEWSMPYVPNSNVLAVLMDIRKNPIRKDGKKVAPVVYEYSCCEETCGTCTMVINKHVRPACSALIDKIHQPIELEPLTKYPIVRDLIVDRSRMFESLKRVKAWVPMDGFHDLGPGEKILPKQQSIAYRLSMCMSCGACTQACPSFNKDNNYIGPAAIAQARLFNMNPTGKTLKNERLDALMDDGGLHLCGNAQVCQQVCPKQVPLVESIAVMGRQTTFHMFKKFFQD